MRPTPLLYDNLLKAFRQLGTADYTGAARLSATTPAIAKRAWLKGWPQRDPTDPPMPPLQSVFEAAALSARAHRQRAHQALMHEQQKKLASAVGDVAQQKAIEGMAARSLMIATDKLSSGTLSMITRVFPKLEAKLIELIEAATLDEDIPLSRLQQIVTWLVELQDRLAKQLQVAQLVERKHMGEADQTIRVTDDRSTEEKVHAMAHTLMSLRTAGRLELKALLPAVVEMGRDVDELASKLIDIEPSERK
jgi:hypothetical protein